VFISKPTYACKPNEIPTILIGRGRFYAIRKINLNSEIEKMSINFSILCPNVVHRMNSKNHQNNIKYEQYIHSNMVINIYKITFNCIQDNFKRHEKKL